MSATRLGFTADSSSDDDDDENLRYGIGNTSGRLSDLFKESCLVSPGSVYSSNSPKKSPAPRYSGGGYIDIDIKPTRLSVSPIVSSFQWLSEREKHFEDSLREDKLARQAEFKQSIAKHEHLLIQQTNIDNEILRLEEINRQQEEAKLVYITTATKLLDESLPLVVNELENVLNMQVPDDKSCEDLKRELFALMNDYSLFISKINPIISNYSLNSDSIPPATDVEFIQSIVDSSNPKSSILQRFMNGGSAVLVDLSKYITHWDTLSIKKKTDEEAKLQQQSVSVAVSPLVPSGSVGSMKDCYIQFDVLDIRNQTAVLNVSNNRISEIVQNYTGLWAKISPDTSHVLDWAGLRDQTSVPIAVLKVYVTSVVSDLRTLVKAGGSGQCAHTMYSNITVVASKVDSIMRIASSFTEYKNFVLFILSLILNDAAIATFAYNSGSSTSKAHSQVDTVDTALCVINSEVSMADSYVAACVISFISKCVGEKTVITVVNYVMSLLFQACIVPDVSSAGGNTTPYIVCDKLCVMLGHLYSMQSTNESFFEWYARCTAQLLALLSRKLQLQSVQSSEAVEISTMTARCVRMLYFVSLSVSLGMLANTVSASQYHALVRGFCSSLNEAVKRLKVTCPGDQVVGPCESLIQMLDLIVTTNISALKVLTIKFKLKKHQLFVYQSYLKRSSVWVYSDIVKRLEDRPSDQERLILKEIVELEQLEGAVLNQLGSTVESHERVVAGISEVISKAGKVKSDPRVTLTDASITNIILYTLHKVALIAVNQSNSPFFNASKHAEPLARVVVMLCQRNAKLSDLITGQFYKSCPLCLPELFSGCNWSNISVLSGGSELSSAPEAVISRTQQCLSVMQFEGTPGEKSKYEQRDKWLARMLKIFSTYCFVMIQSEGCPLNLHDCWSWLGNFVNCCVDLLESNKVEKYALPFMVSQCLNTFLRITAPALYQYSQKLSSNGKNMFISVLHVVKTKIVPNLDISSARLKIENKRLDEFLTFALSPSGPEFKSL